MIHFIIISVNLTIIISKHLSTITQNTMKKTLTRFLSHYKDDGIFQRSCLMVTVLLITVIAPSDTLQDEISSPLRQAVAHVAFASEDVICTETLIHFQSNLML
jgi:hypothetical protein